MTQETLVNELKARVGDPDLSERTVQEVAKNALPMFADDSKVNDDLWNFTVGTVKTAIGQERADRKTWIVKQQETLANADKTAREKWQDEFKEQWAKDHAATVKSEAPAKKGQTEDERIAAAVERALGGYNTKLFGEDGKSGLIGSQLATTSEFIRQSHEQAKEARIEAMRKELKDYLVGKNASREPVINLAVKELALDENSDLDKAKIDVEKSYEAKFKEFYGDGGKPYGGDSAGGSAGGADEDLKKYLESKAVKAKQEAEAADNLRKKFK